MKYLLYIILLITSFTLSANTDWAIVNIPVACIRSDKAHSSEMISQAIMGTPMRVLDYDGGEWLLLEGPDSYRGYVNISSIVLLDSTEMSKWRLSPRFTVKSLDEVKVLSDTLNPSPRNIVTELVNGSIVEGQMSQGNFSHITLPDGRQGWIANESVYPIEEWASQPFDAQNILDRCYYMMGKPYLWGACSTKSVDCSGLVRVAYYANGILLLRDARQQFNIGYKIAPENVDQLQAADLLFFSQTPDGRISHVAIYDTDNRYIHSSGRVKVNSMSDEDPDFSGRVYRGASRIDGMIPSEGIIQLINHPWYFSHKIN